jgi:hypothetical protein
MHVSLHVFTMNSVPFGMLSDNLFAEQHPCMPAPKLPAHAHVAAARMHTVHTHTAAHNLDVLDIGPPGPENSGSASDSPTKLFVGNNACRCPDLLASTSSGSKLGRFIL